MPHHAPQGSEVTRRAVVAGTGILAVSAALAACSSYGNSAASAPDAPADQSAGPAGGSAATGGQALGSTSDIPVGGGAVFASQEVVVTQPTPGNFKAFSAICTHSGCPVSAVANGTINCTCHGSKYNVKDGSVVNGPAKKSLAPRQITVSGDTIQLT